MVHLCRRDRERESRREKTQRGERRREKCGEGPRRGGGWWGLNASERCLIFRHHLFLVFCELEASFVSNTSHTLRAARHQQQGLHHLFQTTAQCDPLHPLTTNHTVFDDVVNPLLERFLPSGSLTKVPNPPLSRG